MSEDSNGDELRTGQKGEECIRESLNRLMESAGCSLSIETRKERKKVVARATAY